MQHARLGSQADSLEARRVSKGELRWTIHTTVPSLTRRTFIQFRFPSKFHPLF
jgi:hypothetical protein